MKILKKSLGSTRPFSGSPNIAKNLEPMAKYLHVEYIEDVINLYNANKKIMQRTLPLKVVGNILRYHPDNQISTYTDEYSKMINDILIYLPQCTCQELNDILFWLRIKTSFMIQPLDAKNLEILQDRLETIILDTNNQLKSIFALYFDLSRIGLFSESIEKYLQHGLTIQKNNRVTDLKTVLLALCSNPAFFKKEIFKKIESAAKFGMKYKPIAKELIEFYSKYRQTCNIYNIIPDKELVGIIQHYLEKSINFNCPNDLFPLLEMFGNNDFLDYKLIDKGIHHLKKILLSNSSAIPVLHMVSYYAKYMSWLARDRDLLELIEKNVIDLFKKGSLDYNSVLKIGTSLCSVESSMATEMKSLVSSYSFNNWPVTILRSATIHNTLTNQSYLDKIKITVNSI